ncbi:hypothetical protein BGZ93_003194 [Podila epicladia]|nr:hypothetical protein BGZ93_003194 [Podila epicladia]
MHPMLQFWYWEHQQWETKYQELAEESVRHVWRKSYKSTLEPEKTMTTGCAPGGSLLAPDGYEFDDDLFGDWALSDFDDLDEYTNSKSASLTAKDVLTFWRNQ